MSAENEPLLMDLEVLAHELECDCNYPFAQLKDSNGELYSTKLKRLRVRLSEIDAMLSEHHEMVVKLAAAEARVKELENAQEAELAKALAELEEAGKKLKDDPQFEEDCQADMRLEKDLAELEKLRERVKELGVELSQSFELAEAQLHAEKLAGNIVKEEFWKGELSALHRISRTLGTAMPRKE